MNERITINGTNWQVLRKDTPESLRDAGYINLAAHMTEENQAAQIYIKRNESRLVFMVVQSAGGAFSTPTRIRM